MISELEITLRDPETQLAILKELTGEIDDQAAIERFAVILAMHKVQEQPAFDALCRLPFKPKEKNA